MQDCGVFQLPFIVKILIARPPAGALELTVKIICRKLICLQKPGFKIRLLPGLLLILHFRQSHAGLLRQVLQRLGKGIIFIIHEEGDHIPPCSAAKAVIHLLSRRHGKGGGFLIVKRAEAEIIRPLFLELHISRNHIYDVVLLPYFLYDFFRIVHKL